MAVHIFTLPFNHTLQGFNNEDLQQFLAGKTVLNYRAEFFMQNNQAFWSLFIEYESIILPKEAIKASETFNAVDKQLYTSLQQWRKDKVHKENIPVYVIATNKELSALVEKKPQSMATLSDISGFGQKKCQRHGEEILTIIKPYLKRDQQKTPEYKTDQNKHLEADKNHGKQ